MSDADRSQSTDELDRALAELPAVDLPTDQVEALRARAHAVLAATPAHRSRSARSRAWRRAELGFAIAVAAAQLLWAFDAAMVPYR